MEQDPKDTVGSLCAEASLAYHEGRLFTGVARQLIARAFRAGMETRPRNYPDMETAADVPEDAKLYMHAFREGIQDAAHAKALTVDHVGYKVQAILLPAVYTMLEDAMAAGAEAVLSTQSDGAELLPRKEIVKKGREVRKEGCLREQASLCEYPHCGCREAKHVLTSSKLPESVEIAGRRLVGADIDASKPILDTGFRDPDLAPGDGAAARAGPAITPGRRGTWPCSGMTCWKC